MFGVQELGCLEAEFWAFDRGVSDQETAVQGAVAVVQDQVGAVGVAFQQFFGEVGQLRGIELQDHIVIGDNRWVSLKERGLV